MNLKKLKHHLEKLYATYNESFLSSDPLWFVHQFKTDKDREITGLIASSLAYGRVAGIKKSIKRVLDIMGWEPYEFTVAFKPSKYKGAFRTFTHRFTGGDDIVCLIYFAKQMLNEYGSIGGFFIKGCSPDDKNVKKLPRRAGVRFLFPSPVLGSPCKRLNLYLRWMVRKDGLDFGIWKDMEPSKLVIPLDTHIARISGYIGLTKRNTADWKTAEEITDALKKLDPSDPVKYDFSLSRLGILEECRRKKDPVKCRACLIKNICVIR